MIKAGHLVGFFFAQSLLLPENFHLAFPTKKKREKTPPSSPFRISIVIGDQFLEVIADIDHVSAKFYPFFLFQLLQKPGDHFS